MDIKRLTVCYVARRGDDLTVTLDSSKTNKYSAGDPGQHLLSARITSIWRCARAVAISHRYLVSII